MAMSDNSYVTVTRPHARSSIILVCEHASPEIPEHMNDLGLDEGAKRSHAAWDPGAFAVAVEISAELDATLVSSNVSRLVYDCNRPPNAKDAMPCLVEAYTIPGNRNLTPDLKRQRQSLYYDGFEAAVAAQVEQRSNPVIVTIHSFAPIYNGVARDVELGILHDADTRLADVILANATASEMCVERNAPYSAEDGVTHTLKRHALPGKFLNVMVEIRNDLITTPETQKAMSATLSKWISSALTVLDGRHTDQSQQACL